MPNNSTVNKVIINGITRLDLTGDTATPSDVAQGKTFHDAAGILQTGTASGGGGGMTLLATKSLGTISTSSTSATDTGQTVTVSNVDNYDLLVAIISVNTKTNGRHVATVNTISLAGTSNASTKNSAGIADRTLNFKLSSADVTSSRQNTTKYGVYVNSATTPSGGSTTLAIYERYNNTYTTTINGDYTIRVYGVKLTDMI